MNRHVWNVFLYELARNIRRKGFLFATFGIPVIGFVIMMGVQLFAQTTTEDQIAELEFDAQGITAGYVDWSGLFPEPGPYMENVLTRYETEANAHDALVRGDIEIYYIIAADYRDTGNVMIVAPRFSANYVTSSTIPIEGMFYGLWIEDVPIETLVRLRAPSEIEQIKFTQNTEDAVTRNEDTDFVLIYGFSIIFLVALFSTNGYLMQSVIEEKETRMVEILISSVRPGQLLTGKILAMSLLGFAQVCAYIGTGIALTQIASSSSALADTFVANLEVPIGKLPLVMLYFVLAYLFFAAGFGAVGALSNSMSEGPNLTLIFVLPSVVPFYFMTLFLENPNGSIPVILSLVPITAPIAMVMRMAMVNVPIIQILASLTLLSSMVVAGFWLAGRLFRMQTLLAGTTPKIRDIPKLLRS